MSDALSRVTRWLSENGVEAKRTYQTISEAGAVVWNDERSSLKIISRSGDLEICLVFLDNAGRYHFYHGPVDGISGQDLGVIRDGLTRFDGGGEFARGSVLNVEAGLGKLIQFKKTL